MTTIHKTDIIYATVIHRGYDIASLRITGVSSFSEILRNIFKAVKGSVGIINIMLRNSSQGWNETRSVMIPLTA